MQTSAIRNYIVYLRNIIFFKVIIVSFVILLLACLIYIFKQDLKISENRYNFVSNNILELQKNLDLISNSKEKLSDNYKKYEEYLSISAQEYCEKRRQLIKTIKELGIKYNLSSEIDVNVVRSFKDNNNSASNQLKVNYYDCIIHFSTSDFAKSINLIKEIYTMMPENSIVNFFEIKEIETLNQDIIEKLTTNTEPNLIAVKLIINLQEISYFVK